MMVSNIANAIMAYDCSVTAMILLGFGFVDLHIGKNESKDVGLMCIACAVCDTIALCFSVGIGLVYDAVVLGLFVFLLWYLGIAFYKEATNMIALMHPTMGIGFVYLGLGILCYTIFGDILMAVAVLLLFPILCLTALHFYLGGRPISGLLEKMAGVFCLVDALLWILIAFNLITTSL